jgi:hypothetical protein
MKTFEQFFEAATVQVLCGYQQRLAGDDQGCPRASQLINISTGFGLMAGAKAACSGGQ